MDVLYILREPLRLWVFCWELTYRRVVELTVPRQINWCILKCRRPTTENDFLLCITDLLDRLTDVGYECVECVDCTLFVTRSQIAMCVNSVIDTLRPQQFTCRSCSSKARFPLPELTARVDGWPVSIWRLVTFALSAPYKYSYLLTYFAYYPSTRPVLTGNGNRSPVNSGRQLG